MRYSFTSYSLPEASLDSILGSAQEFGYDGVELRIDEGHAHGVELDAGPSERARIRDTVRDSGIEVACVGCSATFADPADVGEQVRDAHRVIDLAADIGASRIRVFGGELPGSVTPADALRRVAEAVGSLASHAEDRGITVCVETHDDWSAPSVMAALMARIDHPAVGVVWDVMHPIRSGDSTSQEAWRLLGPKIAHLHVHDGTTRLDRLEFKEMGTGEFDHREVLALLDSAGFDGFLSGEWIDWEPGETHLPREIARLRDYEAQLQGA